MPAVEVIFTGAGGEASTMADLGGAYVIDLPPGPYQVFARGDHVVSAGVAPGQRLPGLPAADAIGAPDPALAPHLELAADVDALDVEVDRSGTVVGTIVGPDGRAVAGAVIEALGDLRPILGSNVTESDAQGRFRLELPAGTHRLQASHDYYAALDDREGTPSVTVEPAGEHEVTLVMIAGCVVSGRVIDAHGNPAGAGSIERQYGRGPDDFAPSGQIADDGTFRWVSTDEVDHVLRAWPWHAPPAPAQRFSCRDGHRYADVVFRLPDRGPDISGEIVSATGEPAPGVFFDVAALDPGGTDQQERSDADGAWSVHALRAGRYRITASSPTLGVIDEEVTVPSHGVELRFGGTGAIAGAVAGMTRGSLGVELLGCRGVRSQEGAQRRLVVVESGRYRLDGLPACTLGLFVASPRTAKLIHVVTVAAGETAPLDLDARPIRTKRVSGRVVDGAGQAAADATVLGFTTDGAGTAIALDRDGRFEVELEAGGSVSAFRGDEFATEFVDEDDDAREQLELRLAPES
ncbi:MAG: carboxypeptidase-like regulatory domain-containing protein [Kofleriaceae bacterium]